MGEVMTDGVNLRETGQLAVQQIEQATEDLLDHHWMLQS